MSRRQRFITAVLAAGVVTLGVGLATLVLSPQQAFACEAPPAGGTGTPNCGPPPPSPPTKPCKTFKTPPRLVVHYSELSPGQSPMTQTLFMIAAVNDVVDAFNEVGGTSARVTSVEATADPFTFNTPYNDTTPTIHLGFEPDIPAWSAAVAPNDWKKTLGATTMLDPAGNGYPLPSIDKCWYLERHIAFPDTSISGFPTSNGAPQQPWSFGYPPATTSTNATRPYFDAGLSDTTAMVTDDTRYANETDVARLWFRPRFLHELLHAFGMGHRHDYSFMNHAGAGGFPWANRSAGDRVRPLPADIGWLRRNYPGSGTVYDVSVLNTWHMPGTEADADDQVALCMPSKGSSWSPDIRGIGFGYCGVDSSNTGPASVCPGDTIRTRFAVANGSTEPVDLTVRLAFSRDEEWGDGDGLLSPTTRSLNSLGAEDSYLMEATWKVPSIDTSSFHVLWHPLVQISGDHVNTDWIPLRGALAVPVTGCPA